MIYSVNLLWISIRAASQSKVERSGSWMLACCRELSSLRIHVQRSTVKSCVMPGTCVCVCVPWALSLVLTRAPAWAHCTVIRRLLERHLHRCIPLPVWVDNREQSLTQWTPKLGWEDWSAIDRTFGRNVWAPITRNLFYLLWQMKRVDQWHKIYEANTQWGKKCETSDAYLLSQTIHPSIFWIVSTTHGYKEPGVYLRRFQGDTLDEMSTQYREQLQAFMSFWDANKQAMYISGLGEETGVHGGSTGMNMFQISQDSTSQPWRSEAKPLKQEGSNLIPV